MSSLDICSVECITLLHCTETRILQGRKGEGEEREGRKRGGRGGGRSRHSGQLETRPIKKDEEGRGRKRGIERRGRGGRRGKRREREEIGTKLVAAHLSDGPGSLGIHGGVGPSCVRKLSWQLLCEV